MKFISIDPGKTAGALAVFNDENIKDVVDLQNDFADLCSFLQTFYTYHNPDYIVIEKVHGTPQQGASGFTFGAFATAPIAVGIALNYPVVCITPQAWQKGLTITKDKNKEEIRSYVQKHYPLIDLGAKVKGRADAIAIGMYFLKTTRN